jgi:hypothetical protein
MNFWTIAFENALHSPVLQTGAKRVTQNYALRHL